MTLVMFWVLILVIFHMNALFTLFHAIFFLSRLTQQPASQIHEHCNVSRLLALSSLLVQCRNNLQSIIVQCRKTAEYEGLQYSIQAGTRGGVTWEGVMGTCWVVVVHTHSYTLTLRSFTPLPPPPLSPTPGLFGTNSTLRTLH